MDIQIEGLNPKQRALCDIIWACDSRDQVLAFVKSLSPKDRQEAEIMVEMMTLAFLDTVDTVDDSVKTLLDGYRI